MDARTAADLAWSHASAKQSADSSEPPHANGREQNADWKAGLILKEDGDPRALLANALLALRLAPEWRGLIRHDAFRNHVMLRGRAPWMDHAVSDTPWADHFDVLTACWMQEQDINVTDTVAGKAVATVAREQIYHPVLDYLARCEWDRTPRLDGWLTTHLGVDNSPYVRAIASRFLISAVARVSDPGCKADCALILEGEQNTSKSTALKTLGAPWFTDDISDFGTKDAAMQLAGAWIIELAELDSISRGDVSRVKAFMSRSTDRFRPPYGHRVIEQPRQCVFAGTVNHSEYLRDETGGRRFWPVKCGTIKIDELAADRDQLWAEALHRHRAGEPWWIATSALTQAAQAEQGDRYQADAWQTMIERFWKPPTLFRSLRC